MAQDASTDEIAKSSRDTADHDRRRLSRALAVAWSEHRRTREMCAGLNLELVVLATPQRGAVRYLLLGVRTIELLMRRRPRVLLVQNPSLVLAVLTVTLRVLLRYRLIVDAHNEAVTPFINTQRWVAGLSRWVIRQSDLTLVTNRQLARVVEQRGGTAFTIPDRIPGPPATIERKLAGLFNVVLISTFAPDEPVDAVVDAVRGSDIELYITGNAPKSAALADAPANVHFTGFLPEADYWSLLQSAHAIVDLTTMDNCLVCGAYEAMALAKPMLLSNNSASVELFGDAAAFTDNSPADIRRGLTKLRTNSAYFEKHLLQKRAELRMNWNDCARLLMAAISGWAESSASPSCGV